MVHSLPLATTVAMADIRAQLAGGPRARAGSDQPNSHVPVDRYFDPAIWRAEQLSLFRSLPLVVAHGSELAPGQVLAHDSYDLPLLLCRDVSGQVRCFLNVCRHRGMRLVESSPQAQASASVVCPYHGWSFQLDGRLRHMLHAQAFDACAPGERDLAALPCVERHGLIWVLPDATGLLDLDAHLGGLDAELPYLGIDQLRHFRTVEAEYPANWKLIVEAFLESYHIRVLHRNTISPFFADGVTSIMHFGPHMYSLVARRAAVAWAQATGNAGPSTLRELCELVTPTQLIFPNTITVFHPDYLSLITTYPTGPETFRWTHRMLIPADKSTPDWTPHWEKTFNLIEKGVFQREDIHCAVGIQRGLKSGANRHLTAGRMEQGVGWFHEQLRRHVDATPPP